MANKIEQRHNPEEYQWIDKNGKPIKLTELSKEDLLQVACDCMAALELLEDKTHSQLAVFEAWRNGKSVAPLSDSTN